MMRGPTSTWPWSAVTSERPRRAAGSRARRRRAGRRSAARRRRSRRSRARGPSCRCRRSRRRRTARRRAAAGRPRPRSPTWPASPTGREPRRWASVKAVPCSSVGRHHRDVVAEEGGEGLDVAGREGPTAVAGGRVPAQHVEDLAAEHHPVAQQPVLGRCQAGGDRAEGGGRGRRRHGGDGPAGERGERRHQRLVGLQLLPAEAVEDQQHDLVGVARPAPGTTTAVRTPTPPGRAAPG